MESNIKHRCYKFSLSVIKFTGTLKIRKVYLFIIDQLLRSATSIDANVVEVRSAHSRKDFIRFNEIALKSADESLYWLCLLRDSIAMNDDRLIRLLDEAKQITKILAASVIQLKHTSANNHRI